MNMLTAVPNGLTMSSREIADRTGKEHRNVLADIRAMLIALHGATGLLSFQHSYRNAQNKEQPCYLPPKRETPILVSGYSVTMRAAIIERWQELETQQAPRIPTHVEALRMAADAFKAVATRRPMALSCKTLSAAWRPPQPPPRG